MSQSELKKALRATIRDQREALTQTQLKIAHDNLATFANDAAFLSNARSVLSYSPSKGEIDPTAVTQRVTNACIYLPRVTDYQNRTMTFHQNGGPLTESRYGIKEPNANQPTITASELDVVLLPLVAFDRDGTRLGMGGGFYDTSFSFCLNKKNHKNRPILVGLAHHFQEVKSLPQEDWDVSLDAILTDRELIMIN